MSKKKKLEKTDASSFFEMLIGMASAANHPEESVLDAALRNVAKQSKFHRTIYSAVGCDRENCPAKDAIIVAVNPDAPCINIVSVSEHYQERSSMPMGVEECKKLVNAISEAIAFVESKVPA